MITQLLAVSSIETSVIDRLRTYMILEFPAARAHLACNLMWCLVSQRSCGTLHSDKS